MIIQADLPVRLNAAAKLQPLGRCLAYASGAVIIGLALTVYLTELPARSIFQWLEQVFSLGFIFIFTTLVSLSVYAIWRVRSNTDASYWFEAGLHAAGGVATVALTFTLLGISLGIGSLAQQNITPETVQTIVQSLTKHFSTAFMTTVVGLPVAGGLRAWLSLTEKRRQQLVENES